MRIVTCDSATLGWLTAVGTLAAVAAALFIAWWQEHRRDRRRPDLVLFLDEDELLQPETVFYGSGGPGYHSEYLRLAVGNLPGNDAAADVEVLLSSMRRTDRGRPSAHTGIAFPGFGWTHSTSSRLTIPPGVRRFIDIGCFHLDPPEPLIEFVGGKLDLKVNPPPGNGRHVLPPGAYELGLTVSAHNADAKRYRLKLKFEDPSGRQSARAALSVSLEGPIPGFDLPERIAKRSQLASAKRHILSCIAMLALLRRRLD